MGKAKRSSNLVFWFSFKIIGKVPDDSDLATIEEIPEGSQEERTINRALVPNTLSWLVGDLKALGVTGEFKPAKLDPENPEAYDLENIQFYAKCSEKIVKDETTGKDRVFEEWKVYREREEPERPSQEIMDASFAILEDTYKATMASKGLQPAGVSF